MGLKRSWEGLEGSYQFRGGRGKREKKKNQFVWHYFNTLLIIISGNILLLYNVSVPRLLDALSNESIINHVFSVKSGKEDYTPKKTRVIYPHGVLIKI